MTLVIATGGIDLSVGSLMAIAGALAPLIFLGKLLPLPHPAFGIALAFVLPVLVAGALGWFNGWLITRLRIQPIIATLVLFIAGRGIAQVMTNGNLQVFKLPELPVHRPRPRLRHPVPGDPDDRHRSSRGLDAPSNRCSADRSSRSAATRRAARLAGIPVAFVKQRRLRRSADCSAGIAGLIVIARNSAADANLVGLGMELDAIAAVAVGGTLLTGGRATVLGTLVGALIIQLVRYTLLANGVPDAAALDRQGRPSSSSPSGFSAAR